MSHDITRCLQMYISLDNLIIKYSTEQCKTMTQKVQPKNSGIPKGLHHDDKKHLTTNKAILDPSRLAALDDCDTSVYGYHRYSLLRDFQHCRGRNWGMLVLPLLLLVLWGIVWQLIFSYADDDGELKDTIETLWNTISPLLIPISFLMVFRLNRAAMRFWESRYLTQSI